MNRFNIPLFGTLLCLLGLGFSDTAKGQQVLTAVPPSGQMSFTVQSGGATATQNLSISYVNGATTLCLNMQNAPGWLTVEGVTPGNSGSTLCVNTPSNGTPAVFPITVNTAGLSTGQQPVGTFTVQVSQLPSSLITYSVVLNVGSPSLLSASLAVASFSAVQGSLREPRLRSRLRSLAADLN